MAAIEWMTDGYGDIVSEEGYLIEYCGGRWEACIGSTSLCEGTLEQCIEACNKHNADFMEPTP